MRTVKTALLGGAAALGVLALAGVAMAAGPVFHEMTIELPGGGVEHVRYTGNVAPKVVFEAVPVAASSGYWNAAWPFAELDQISALMDQQFAQMMEQARVMNQMAAAGGLNEAVLQNAPPGTSGYSMITTLSGNGYCSRSVQITSSPNGPKVVSHSSGDCGSTANVNPQAAGGMQPADGLRTIALKTVHRPSAHSGGI